MDDGKSISSCGAARCGSGSANLRAARNRWEALDRERDERAKLEAGAPLESAIPIFRHFASEFLETYAVTNNKPSEVETKRAIRSASSRTRFRGASSRHDRSSGHRALQRRRGSPRASARRRSTTTWTVLRRVLAVAAEWGKLRSVPNVRWLKVPPPEFDFLTFEEAARLVDGADAEWRAMILLALRTGLRQGELLGLRWDDVDLVCGSTRGAAIGGARSRRDAEDGKSREVPLSDDAIAILRSMPSRISW